MAAAMRTALVAVALLASACRPSCGTAPGAGPGTPAPPPPSKASSAPVPDAIQALRDADAAFQRGDLEEAIRRAEAAAASGSPVALNLLGRAHAARFERSKDGADARKAREAFTRAATASPDFWPALQNLGELEEKTGRLKEAADAYRKVLEAQPGHPDRARFEAAIQKASRP